MSQSLTTTRIFDVAYVKDLDVAYVISLDIDISGQTDLPKSCSSECQLSRSM